MKALIKFYSLTIILIILFVSCENKTELTGNYISGTVENYDPTTFDSINCMDYQLDSNYLMITKYHKVGKCTISKNGNFNTALNEPLYTYPIMDRIDKAMVISDSTAIIGYLILQAYKNGNVVGYVIKCSEEYYNYPTGSNFSTMIYVNKDVTINGTSNIGINFSTTYHLNLKKGWNEVINTYTVTTLGTTTKSSLDVTNTTTEDLKWRFIKYN